MIKQITFKVKHDPGYPNEIRINGKGPKANVGLRRNSGWDIPDEDYEVTWKLSARGKWAVEDHSDMEVYLRGEPEYTAYQVCVFPLSWMGKRLTRIVKILHFTKRR